MNKEEITLKEDTLQLIINKRSDGCGGSSCRGTLINKSDIPKCSIVHVSREVAFGNVSTESIETYQVKEYDELTYNLELIKQKIKGGEWHRS